MVQRNNVIVDATCYFTLLLVDLFCIQYQPMLQRDLFTVRSMTLWCFDIWLPVQLSAAVIANCCAVFRCQTCPKAIWTRSGWLRHGRTRYTLRYSGPLRWSRLHVLASRPFCISFVLSFYELDEIYDRSVCWVKRSDWPIHVPGCYYVTRATSSLSFQQIYRK